jgi:hypothetical protein
LIVVAVFVSLRTLLLKEGFVFKDDMAFPFEEGQVREAFTNRFSVWYGKTGGGFDPTLPSNIPFWTSYNLFGLVLSPEFLNKFFITLPFIISGFSMYIFSRRKFSTPSGLVAAFLYTFNPWTFDRLMSGHLNLLMAYALIPIPLLFIFKERFTFRDAILAALVTGLILSFTMHMFSLLFLLAALYVIFEIVLPKRFRNRRRIGTTALVFVIALGLNSYWLLPLSTDFSFINNRIMVSVEGSTVNILNDQAKILNTIRLSGYWLPYFRSSIGELGLFSAIWFVFSFMIPILSFLVVFLKKDRMTAFFSIGAIAFLVPSIIASNSPDVYLRLIDYFPPLALFRDSDKFIAVVCLCYSILIGILLERFLAFWSQTKVSNYSQTRLRRFAKVSLAYVAVCSVVICTLVYVAPNVISGDYLGQLNSTTPPSYWFEVKDFLSGKDESNWRVLWTPPFSELRYEWNQAGGVDPVDEYLSPAYSVSPKSRSPFLENYLNFLTSSMYEEHFDTDIGKILSPLSVRYIVVRLDAALKWKDPQEYPTPRLQEVFEHQMGLSKVFESGKWIVYENVYSKPYVTVHPLDATLVLGNISAVTSLSHLSENDLPLLLFMDSETLSPNDIDKLAALSNIAANTTTLTLAVPMDQSSAKSDLLEQIKGKVRMIYFVEGEKLSRDQKDIMPNHSFEEGLTHWNLSNSVFSMKLSEDAIQGRYSLEVTTACNAANCWSCISSDDMPIVSGMAYRFSTNIKLSNVQDSHIKVMGFNKVNERWEEICWLPAALSGTQGWTNHEFVWQTSQNFTKIRILLNAGWVNDALMGNATTLFDDINIAPFASYNTSFSNGSALPLQGIAKTEVEFVSSSTYRIALRMLSTEEAQINVRLYNNYVQQIMHIPVEPNSLNFFYSEPVYLPSGNFTLEISSEKLVNLDSIAIVSVEKANETLQDIFVSREASTKVISLKRVSSTNYVIDVNSTEPFLLSVSEAYDHLWIAHVNGQRIESTPLYSAINGFWINQTGQLEITVAYEAQEYFYYGSATSIAILVVCVTYLAYDWAKNKSIRRRLERILKHWVLRHATFGRRFRLSNHIQDS